MSALERVNQSALDLLIDLGKLLHSSFTSMEAKVDFGKETPSSAAVDAAKAYLKAKGYNETLKVFEWEVAGPPTTKQKRKNKNKSKTDTESDLVRTALETALMSAKFYEQAIETLICKSNEILSKAIPLVGERRDAESVGIQGADSSDETTSMDISDTDEQIGNQLVRMLNAQSPLKSEPVVNAPPSLFRHSNPPEMANGNTGPPATTNSNGRTLFIGNLAFHVNERDIRNILHGYGDIERIQVIKNADQSSRGFAFCTMKTEDDAKAVAGVNGMYLEGRPMRIKIDTGMNFRPANSQLSVVRQPPGSIARSSTPVEAMSATSLVPDNISNRPPFLLPDTVKSPPPPVKMPGIVRLPLPPSASLVHIPMPFKDSRRTDLPMPTIHKLYVSNLPKTFNESAVSNVFNRFGNLDSVYIPRFATTNSLKDYCFVNFKTLESAQKVIDVARSEEGIIMGPGDHRLIVSFAESMK